MGDFNEDKHRVIDLFTDRGCTKLETDPTFTAHRNGSRHFNDLIFFKGVDVELIEQVPGTRTGSDHDGLLISIKNGKPSNASPKYLLDKLKTNPKALRKFKESLSSHADFISGNNSFTAEDL